MPIGQRVGSGFAYFYDYFPLSPRARHGAVCSEHRMSIAFRSAGQICAFGCPSPQSSLTTGPRFAETPAMTALGRNNTGKRGQVCVVPKLSRVIDSVQIPAPQGEKVAHWLKGGEWECLFL